MKCDNCKDITPRVVRAAVGGVVMMVPLLLLHYLPCSAMVTCLLACRTRRKCVSNSLFLVGKFVEGSSEQFKILERDYFDNFGSHRVGDAFSDEIDEPSGWACLRSSRMIALMKREVKILNK